MNFIIAYTIFHVLCECVVAWLIFKIASHLERITLYTAFHMALAIMLGPITLLLALGVFLYTHWCYIHSEKEDK